MEFSLGAKPLSDPWNRLKWNLIQNRKVFIQENEIENVVCKMAAILSRPRCINVFSFGDAMMLPGGVSKTRKSF